MSNKLPDQCLPFTKTCCAIISCPDGELVVASAAVVSKAVSMSSGELSPHYVNHWLDMGIPEWFVFDGAGNGDDVYRMETVGELPVVPADADFNALSGGKLVTP